MNALAATPDGVLAPKSFLEKHDLHEGDPLELDITTDIGRVVLLSTIVGSFDLFPTWYPETDGPLFVGNLESLFDQAGGFTAYQVWVKTNPKFDFSSVSKIELPGLGVKVLSWISSPPRIAEIQGRPEQQGIFGFLFIGFSCAALLTVIGFLVYALFSFRQRFIELGVLRALGLNRNQMATGLAFELLFLLLIGATTGTGLGLWASRQFIPFLQIGEKAFERIPPFEVMIDWSSIIQIYWLFGILFIITLSLLVAVLQRMKIFQAIKMGESL